MTHGGLARGAGWPPRKGDAPITKEAPPSLAGLPNRPNVAGAERTGCRGRLAAAGVEPAARARVAAARALHHAATLLAGRTEVEALAQGGDDRRLVGECGRRRERRAARVPVAAVAVA